MVGNENEVVRRCELQSSHLDAKIGPATAQRVYMEGIREYLSALSLGDITEGSYDTT